MNKSAKFFITTLTKHVVIFCFAMWSSVLCFSVPWPGSFETATFATIGVLGIIVAIIDIVWCVAVIVNHIDIDKY